MSLAIRVMFVVACLLIFSSLGLGSRRDHALVRKTLLARFCCHNDERSSSKDSAMAQATKNNTLDDKRVVPTGPNPLHNR
ncbi:hypothetical protein SLE2022_149870 [Rubroshorea leprosula]